MDVRAPVTVKPVYRSISLGWWKHVAWQVGNSSNEPRPPISPERALQLLDEMEALIRAGRGAQS